MFRKQEPVISMTPDELAALVDARIAERDAQARQAEEAKKPKPEPRPPDPAYMRRYLALTPEVEALFINAFDDAGKSGLAGDEQIGQAVVRIYSALQAIPPGQPPRILDAWRGCPWESLDWMERALEQGRVASAIRQLDRKRKNPSYREEQVAERMRLAQGIAKNARYWEEARQLCDFTDDELKAEVARRAKAVPV